MEQIRTLRNLKLVDYRNICEVKNFKDLENQFTKKNHFYLIEQPEKITVIPPSNAPVAKDFIPTSCTTNEFYLARINDGICIKNQIITYGDKYILPDTFRNYDLDPPHRSLQYNRITNSFLIKNKLTKQIFVPGDSIFLSGENSNGFGHFLLEVISRLWITQYLDISQYKILMNPHDRKRWQLDLLRALGIRSKQIVYLHHPTKCERLHIPVQSFVLRKYASTFASSIWQKIADYYDDGLGPKKIYVSRSKLNKKRRILRNELAVEQLFASHGFMIIHPQELTIKQQINFFRNAEMIAGPSGSAMYNCVFQNNPTIKLILTPSNFFKLSDVLINTLNKGKLHYFTGETVDVTLPENVADWTIDTGILQKYLHNLLNEMS